MMTAAGEDPPVDSSQEKKMRGRLEQPRIRPFTVWDRPTSRGSTYIFPSVNSASRTCASVKLDVLGYFSITVR
jgi:hypothetical protein